MGSKIDFFVFQLKKELLIIGYILFSQIFSFDLLAQWEIKKSGVSANLKDLCFIDPLHGWAVGDDATIIATIDGGKNWQKQVCPVTIVLEAVCFMDERVGYIVGRSGIILSTKDGGTNWVLNKSGTDISLWSVSFANKDTGWAAGGDLYETRSKGVILHTKNGGLTWEKQLETYANTISSPPKLFRSVDFYDEKNGWALAGAYFDNFSETYIYRTTDGGKNWNTVSLVRRPLVRLKVVSLDTIWAGGWGFARSKDGGLHWAYRETFGELGTIGDIAPLNGLEGWVRGRSLFFTENAMETWTEIPLDPRMKKNSLRAIETVSKNILWAVGDSGSVVNYIRKVTSIDDKGSTHQIPGEVVLYQNYPNPFNAGTVIRLELFKTDDIRLRIYDLEGRKIIELVSQTLGPGIHSALWDGKNSDGRPVPSGIYYYELQGHKFKSRRKALLIR